VAASVWRYAISTSWPATEPAIFAPTVPRQITVSVPGDDVEREVGPAIYRAYQVCIGAHGVRLGDDAELLVGPGIYRADPACIGAHGVGAGHDR
jgi:hypothetical protein